MHSPSQKELNEALLCPVCFVMFEGRIIQCQMGHAVCEKCSMQLNECPQCRSIYLGTRNYVLEEVVAKLKRLYSKNPTLRLNADEQENKEPVRTNNSSDQTQSTESIIASDFLRNVLYYPPPVQAAGKYDCRMLKCTARLPMCRILNHIRYFHKELLTEVFIERDAIEYKFIANYPIPNKSFRHALHLKQYGYFFLIFNVRKLEDDRTKFFGWIQCICPNNDARNFLFKMSLKVGNTVAEYGSFVYGAQSNQEYIESSEHCLHYTTNHTYRNVCISIEIERNTGPKNIPRLNDTVVLALQNPRSNRRQNPNSSNTNDDHTNSNINNTNGNNNHNRRNRGGGRRSNRRSFQRR